jgi:hypothetical protein
MSNRVISTRSPIVSNKVVIPVGRRNRGLGHSPRDAACEEGLRSCEPEARHRFLDLKAPVWPSPAGPLCAGCRFGRGLLRLCCPPTS